MRRDIISLLSKKGVILIRLLYHGTIDKYAADIILNGVNLQKSKSHLDFGPGFYTTPDFEFALETANNRMKRYNFFHPNEKPVTARVLVFECDETAVSSLNVKRFDAVDLLWGQFILANRCENEIVHKQYDHNIDSRYDIVSGPTADGKGTLTPIVEQVNNAEISIEKADYISFAPAQHKNWGKQISFHTVQSLSCIRLKRMI